MKYIPFGTPLGSDQEPAATAEIIEFPQAIVLGARLREAQRQVERLEQQGADNDIRSSDSQERIRAIAADVGLGYWQPTLREAEAAVAMLDADDTLTFQGQMYRAHRSSNGAN